METNVLSVYPTFEDLSHDDFFVLCKMLQFPSPKVKVSNHLHQPCLRAVFVWSLGLLTYLLLGYIVLIREDSLPQPRPSDISLSEFSEGRYITLSHSPSSLL
jgi:hypothetical protein